MDYYGHMLCNDASTDNGQELLPDGFPGQRICVLPGPLVEKASAEVPLSSFLVTDVGYFPRADRHGRSRPQGVTEFIILICTAGQGWCRIDGKTYAVAAGTVVVIPPGLPHSYGALSKDPWTIWWIHLTGLGPAQTLRLIKFPTPLFTLVDIGKATTLIGQIIDRLEVDQTSRSLIACTGLAWNLACVLLADSRPPSHGKLDPVDLAISHLRSSAPLTLTVKELAHMVGLSPSYLSTLFKRRTGLGILEYQTQQRMAIARELLGTTDLSVSQIASRCGYSDPFYFSRHFRTIHSMSPSSFRAHNAVTEG